MNLIIDNGGTKAIWTIADQTEMIQTFNMPGIYPPHSSDENFTNYLESGKKLMNTPVDAIFFYSTGCKLLSQRLTLKRLFEKSFPAAINIEIDTDLLAAARSLCGKSPGIACILGTGSNTCLYDGHQITQNLGGLGYIMGDEGSGALIGKSILKAYVDKLLPFDLTIVLEKEYNLSVDSILHNVYKEQGPNKYLATFAPFALKYRLHPFVKSLLHQQFISFFEKTVMAYPGFQGLPIHCLGSIAVYFEQELKQAAASLEINVMSFKQDPMPGLIEFHAKKNLPIG